MKQTKSELDDGQLDKYSLKESSDQDQFKTIQKAYKQQKPIVFTAMEPSWFSKELDIKMLKDPEKIYGKDDEHINLVFNKISKMIILLHIRLQHVFPIIGAKMMKKN